MKNLYSRFFEAKATPKNFAIFGIIYILLMLAIWMIVFKLFGVSVS